MVHLFWIEWDTGCLDSRDLSGKVSRDVVHHLLDFVFGIVDRLAETTDESGICVPAGENPINAVYTI